MLRPQSDHTGWMVRSLIAPHHGRGIVCLGLLIISAYAAWQGMKDFAAGAPAAAIGHEFLSGWPGIHAPLLLGLAAMLSLLLFLSLRTLTAAGHRPIRRLLALPVYGALLLWSVSFGYGYWWSVLARQDSGQTDVAALQLDARDAAAVVSARITSVKTQMDLALAWSDNQMAREESSGNTCGATTGAGRVGLFIARRSVRDSVTALRDSLDKSWFTLVQTEVDMLRRAAAGLDTVADAGALPRLDSLAVQIRGGARSVAYRNNGLGRTFAADLRALADTVSVPSGQTGFLCHDPVMAMRLRQTADQAAETTRLQLREAVFSNGPAGVANAINNLCDNLGIYANSLTAYASSGRALASGTGTIDHTSGGEPVTGRDMIALMAPLVLALGLFVVALTNPMPAGRRHGERIVQPKPASVLAQPSAMRHLASSLRIALERGPGTNLEWLRQHFIHHAGATYFVIPNLSGVRRQDGDQNTEELRAMALNQLAGVLEDIRLVRSISASALHALMASGDAMPDDAARPPAVKWLRKSTVQPVTDPAAPSPRHELLSKADRALAIAGWSAESLRNIEVFQVVHQDGSAPLLCLINQTTLERGIRAVEDAHRMSSDQTRHGPLRLEYHRSGA